MVASSPADSFVGAGGGHGSARLGKYQLIRRLATGGMAELFLARASAMHGFEKLVVLKRILPQHAESEDFIRMFLAEARLAARLHHPNIVQVYDIGEDSGQYFFTMEFVQGQDLRKLVRAARKAQRAIPLEHILHVVMGMAAGLHSAHEKQGLDGTPLGIVHRDVSPSNVLVTYEGDVKIVDFGIAKAATAQVATIVGTLKGKIPYMSPEQCRGEAVDRRSDIFSIGTLLWELTTGKRLFAGDNEFAIMNRVAQGDVPSPSSIRPEYPPELEAIVMRALQADPENRYTSAIDLQLDLEDFAREARLPVSSARMGKFMRDLFPEEMRQAVIDQQNDRTEIAPVSAFSGVASLPAPANSSSEFTPSELRSHPDRTPGMDLDDGSGSGTEIAVDRVPGRMSPRAIGLVVGGFATAGLVALVLGTTTLGDFGSEKAPAKKTPAVVVPTPTPQPQVKPEPKPQPKEPEPVAIPEPPPPLVETPPEPDPAVEAEVSDVQAGGEVAEEPPEQPAAKDGKPKKGEGRPKGAKKPHKRPRAASDSSPKPPKKPPKPKKKWNQDDALAPGL